MTLSSILLCPQFPCKLGQVFLCLFTIFWPIFFLSPSHGSISSLCVSKRLRKCPIFTQKNLCRKPHKFFVLLLLINLKKYGKGTFCDCAHSGIFFGGREEIWQEKKASDHEKEGKRESEQKKNNHLHIDPITQRWEERNRTTFLRQRNKPSYSFLRNSSF